MSGKAKASNLIPGATGDWEVVIGLEVHAQVASNSKTVLGIFDSLRRRANSHVSSSMRRCPMLPVINEEWSLKRSAPVSASMPRSTSEAFSTARTTSIPIFPRAIRSASTSSLWSVRARSKSMSTASRLKVGIERLHLEQDAGKSIHDQHPEYSYVDLNRSAWH